MADDQERSGLRVVSSRTELEVRQQRCCDSIRCSLQKLAANLIQVTLGEGRSHDIGKQCVVVITALEDYRELVGTYPDGRFLVASLDITRDYEIFRGAGEGELDLAMAEDSVVRAGTPAAAYRLLGQTIQMSRARSDLLDGFEALQRARKKMIQRSHN